METNDESIYTKSDMKFKSYYVVWKPDVLASLHLYIAKFKSYYVVWKQM